MKRFLRTHVLAINIILATSLASAILIGYAGYSVDRKIESNKAKAEVYRNQMDKKIATIKAEKIRLAAEAAAKKKAEEEKTARETAAKKKAEAEAKARAQQSTPNYIQWSGAHSNPALLDAIVNKKHPIQPINFVPNITTIICAPNNTSATVSTLAATDLKALCKDAAKAGISLYYEQLPLLCRTSNHL